MLTFAAWHWLALLSVLFAGIFSFILKVGAERTHSSAYLNGVTSAVSLGCSLVGMWVFGETLSWALFWLAVVNGFMYVFGSVARSDALVHIDATLFFPLYKIAGPVIVLVAGLVVFGERFTLLQGIGFVLALAVPLLLIDKVETTRQKDLARGIWLMLLTAFMIAGGTIFSKAAMDAGAGAMAFSAVAYAMTVLGIAAPYALKRHRDAAPHGHWGDIVWLGALGGLFQFLGFITLLLAYKAGSVATTYAINSTYILIPIVLSIWYYGEHWNARKVIAIGLSIVAVVLLR